MWKEGENVKEWREGRTEGVRSFIGVAVSDAEQEISVCVMCL